MPRVHYLKTWPDFFAAVQSGEKTFEIRKDDRAFGVGDELRLEEFIPDLECGRFGASGYTGAHICKRVSYILRGGQFGLEEGYCIMGLAELEAR